MVFFLFLFLFFLSCSLSVRSGDGDDRTADQNGIVSSGGLARSTNNEKNPRKKGMFTGATDFSVTAADTRRERETDRGSERVTRRLPEAL